MNKSLVSVIIPTFNSSGYIERTIKSVLNQSWSNFEILIIDDFSDDFEILKKRINCFSDERIKIHQLLSKNYASGARNVGVNIAKGEYIAYLDSDDEWFDNKLLKNIQTIEKFENQDVVLFSSAIVTLPHRQIILPQKSKPDRESIATYKIIKHGSIFTPAIFLKKSTANKVKWDESLVENHEDFKYCLDLEEIGAKFIFITDILLKVNWEEGRDKRKKRGSWIYSYKFYYKNKKYFSKRECKYFLFDNIFLRLIQESNLLLACKLIFKLKLYNILLMRLPYFTKKLNAMIFTNSRFIRK